MTASDTPQRSSAAPTLRLAHSADVIPSRHSPTSAERLAAELDRGLELHEEIQRHAKKDKRYGFDEPWAVFLRRMRYLIPQMYGTRIQNRLAEEHGWAEVHKDEDRGDVRYPDGTHHEIKVTMLTPTRRRANFVQLRPHQDIDGYHLVVIDQQYERHHLWLSKAEMAAEIELLGRVAHGTKGTAKQNVRPEYEIRFVWNPIRGTTRRWLDTYAYDPAGDLPAAA